MKNGQILNKAPYFQYSIDGKIFKMQLNRPKKFNALTLDMYRGIIGGLAWASKNPAIRMAVLTGGLSFNFKLWLHLMILCVMPQVFSLTESYYE